MTFVDFLEDNTPNPENLEIQMAHHTGYCNNSQGKQRQIIILLALYTTLTTNMSCLVQKKLKPPVRQPPPIKQPVVKVLK